MIKDIMLVALGGGAGSALRFLVSRAVTPMSWLSLPIGTLLVNVAGCFVIGLVYGLSARGTAGNGMRLLLTTGFCGGFTTFSTFSAENVSLMQEGCHLAALLYVFLSMALGFTAVVVGEWAAKIV